MLACELEPGGRVGAHVQEHFAEIVIVIEGDGHALVGTKPARLFAGALGETLSIRNDSSEQALRNLILKAD